MATGLRWQNARLKPHTVEKAREPRIEGFRAQVNVGSVFVANPAQDVLRLVFPGGENPLHLWSCHQRVVVGVEQVPETVLHRPLGGELLISPAIR